MTIGKYKPLADKGLETWDDICILLNIKHFLIHGTCLGMYRGGEYIPGDDVDVGFMCSDEDYFSLIGELKEKGFVELARAQEISGIKMKFDFVNSYHQSELEFLETLDTVNYRGRAYNIPHPVEDYLELHYGYYGDWRIPIRRHAPSRIVRTGAYNESIKHMWYPERAHA
ncbi:unnamed protein product [marine sediment metagenome]|uniref:LicD/FKTN/FKRP nucleotidyltransferase domain-containing protein n=1 Tax=marine sediment metagenome TaxID=412755 RepID=X1CJG5_9ZZZZ